MFLDCLKAKNLGYCKNLLSDEIFNCGLIENFFSDFDDFYSIKENIFVLIKKNTLSGILKFEVLNNKITNIIEL